MPLAVLCNRDRAVLQPTSKHTAKLWPCDRSIGLLDYPNDCCIRPDCITQCTSDIVQFPVWYTGTRAAVSWQRSMTNAMRQKKKIATTTDWTLDAVGECVCALAESTRNGLASTGALSTNRLELTSFEDCVTVWSAQNGTENNNRAGRPVSNGHSIGHERTRYLYYYWLPYRLRLIDSLIVSPTDCARYYTIPS